MNINIEDHRMWIYTLLNKAKFPLRETEDGYQDFVVHYYSYCDELYDKSSSEAHWLAICFRGFLAEKARRFKSKGRDARILEGDSYDSNFWERTLGEQEIKYENSVLWQEYMKDASEDLQEYLLELAGGDRGQGEAIKKFAERDGVTRQAIELRIKRELRKLLEGK